MTSTAPFVFIALGAAFGFGIAGAVAIYSTIRRRRRTVLVRGLLDIPDLGMPWSGDGGLGVVAGMAASCTSRGFVPLPAPLQTLEQVGSARFPERLRRAGLDGRVSVPGLCRARLRMAVLCGCAGAFAGMVFTPSLGVLAMIAGALAGWKSVTHMLARRAQDRRKALEAHLSQALEVVCLGLRAGLTFDRSLSLYCSCFGGSLACELQGALGLWQAGMKTREQALRDLASTYDSQLFERVVDGIVRSLRFGSSLADGLEALAQEARLAHRARVEEEVMKAPVKMMVPVGVLILPSMLILVLGPVLLDLMNGF